MRIIVADFDLAVTLHSGQVFRWKEKAPGHFAGWIHSHPIRLRQEGNHLLAEGASAAEVERFFDLNADFPSIARSIDIDPILHEALQAHWGLRLIRQDPWECLASFILSSFNNIPRLTGMIERLCARFGEPAMSMTSARQRVARLAAFGAPARRLTPSSAVQKNRARAACGGATPSIPAAGPDPKVLSRPSPRLAPATLPLAYSFPAPEKLTNVPERALRDLGLGFRAPYLRMAAQAAAAGRADLERWNSLDDDALRKALLGIPGVGEKVVECVMLFAYGRTSAFPVDVWIGRAMRRWYFRSRKVTDRKIREFARKHFGPHCGWAQQYLYCAARGAEARISLERTEPSGAKS